MESNIIQIDKIEIPEILNFIGKKEWTVCEQNEQSLFITEIDINKIILESSLGLGRLEKSIRGEMKINRLKKSGYITLDFRFFLIFWKNSSLVKENWKKEIDGQYPFIFFDGTIFEDSHHNRFVIYMYWLEGKLWWDVFGLDSYFYENDLSAVIQKEAA